MARVRRDMAADRAKVANAGIIKYNAINRGDINFTALIRIFHIHMVAGEVGRRGAASHDGIVQRDKRRFMRCTKRLIGANVFQSDRMAAFIIEVVLRAGWRIFAFIGF